MSSEILAEVEQQDVAKLNEYKDWLRVVMYIGSLPDRQRSPVQAKQYQDVLAKLQEHIEEFFELMTKSEFSSIIFFEEDSDVYDSVGSALMDPRCQCPKFPDKFTPADIERLSVHVYQAQTTISGLLEELEPAYKRWVEYEDRCKKIWKAIACMDKEWQSEAAFQIHVPVDVWQRIRKTAESIACLKLRMDALCNAQNVLSRLITLFQLTPGSPLSRTSSLGGVEEEIHMPPPKSFEGKRGFVR